MYQSDECSIDKKLDQYSELQREARDDRSYNDFYRSLALFLLPLRR
jgi:hypothetical protein